MPAHQSGSELSPGAELVLSSCSSSKASCSLSGVAAATPQLGCQLGWPQLGWPQLGWRTACLPTNQALQTCCSPTPRCRSFAPAARSSAKLLPFSRLGAANTLSERGRSDTLCACPPIRLCKLLASWGSLGRQRRRNGRTCLPEGAAPLQEETFFHFGGRRPSLVCAQLGWRLACPPIRPHQVSQYHRTASIPCTRLASCVALPNWPSTRPVRLRLKSQIGGLRCAAHQSGPCSVRDLTLRE